MKAVNFLITVGISVAIILTFSCSGGNIFVDPRDGKTYKIVKIGKQIWMAENLNYAVEGSLCYDNDLANCDKYGRLYNWATAMALPEECNENECKSQLKTPHIGVCPKGWHLPTNVEWDELLRYVDGNNGTKSPYSSPTAGKHLKAKQGWDSYEEKSGNGTDDYGFAALPGGDGFPDDGFFYVGIFGSWWSTIEGGSNMDMPEFDASFAYYRSMHNDQEFCLGNSYFKTTLYNVRCMKD